MVQTATRIARSLESEMLLLCARIGFSPPRI